MPVNFFIHPDISRAETLPASFYRDKFIFDRLKETVFLQTWQWIGDVTMVAKNGSVYPFVLLDDFLTEPLLLTKNQEGKIYCLSNVCTHRGNLVADQPGVVRKLQCMYHGRRFDHDGNFEFMPEFKEAKDFPRPCDHLQKFPLKQWGPLLFTALDPVFNFDSVIERMHERIGFLQLDRFEFSEAHSKDYQVNAHWALYCDNYLEGLHIPFVHPELNKVLDYGNYTTELYDHCNVQIGYAEDDSVCFDLPEGHMDYGKKVAAYYFWIFPNMMFNFYPWGLSVNVIKPLEVDKCLVSFVSYIYDESKLEAGAGSILDKVEMEDEYVVEGVQKGIKSRFYNTGRFSPTREQGVHHFHGLLARFVNEEF
jgi:choline monooxygenase